MIRRSVLQVTSLPSVSTCPSLSELVGLLALASLSNPARLATILMTFLAPVRNVSLVNCVTSHLTDLCHVTKVWNLQLLNNSLVFLASSTKSSTLTHQSRLVSQLLWVKDPFTVCLTRKSAIMDTILTRHRSLMLIMSIACLVLLVAPVAVPQAPPQRLPALLATGAMIKMKRLELSASTPAHQAIRTQVLLARLESTAIQLARFARPVTSAKVQTSLRRHV